MITLKEFFKEESACIHCDTLEKADKLLKEFDRLGKKWRKGNSYLEENCWYDERGNTCYDNVGCYDNINFFKMIGYKIYEFEDIIFVVEKKENRKESKKMKNQKYIFRGNRSGVFFGTLLEKNGQEVKIGECRRLWYWDGACSISEIAKIGTTRPDNCKFTVTVEELTILDCIEIIPCTEKATKIIEEVKEWKRS